MGGEDEKRVARALNAYQRLECRDFENCIAILDHVRYALMGENQWARESVLHLGENRYN
jgi:hypothetical protein